LAQIMTEEMQQAHPLISLKGKPGKEQTFLRGLVEGAFETDEQAAKEIYGA